MADKKISQLTPTTTVDLADRYALARGAGNFYVSYNTLKTNLSVNTGSFVKTVNAVAPDAVGNVAVSLASVETGLSSSFPALPSDGDVYVISGETATDRTGSNGQSFIYSSTSVDWFRLSGLDEAGNDARYVNISGDTMTGDLILNGNPITSNQAVNKAYVDGLTTNGTDGQTIRFNGTTPVANSVLFNNGTNIGIGTTNPEELVEIRRLVSAGNDNFALQLTNPLTTADSRIGILFADNTNTGANRDGAAIQVSNSNVNGRGHLTFGPVQNMTMTEVMRITQDQKVGIGTDTPSTKLEVDGTGKFGGQLDMSTNKITNVVDPTAAQDAATKQYTDLFYDSSSFNSSGNVLQLHKGNSTIDSITIVSSSYAVTASHAITASSVLHLEQDVYISGTLYQSGSVEMSRFEINNLGGPYETKDAATKEYIDRKKLDTIYDIFDLDLDSGYSETIPTGQAWVVETIVSASIPIVATHGNSSTTLIVREFNTGSEDFTTIDTGPVTSQLPRASGVFVSASHHYFTTIHNSGVVYLQKFDGSSLTLEQTTTAYGACREKSSHVTAQDANDENNAIICYASTNYNIVRYVSGSYEAAVSTTIPVTPGGGVTNTTNAVHFNGDYYITIWNETNDRREIWKYDFEAETATNVVTLPSMTGGARHGGVFMPSGEKLYEAHGTQVSTMEIYEIDVVNNSYRQVGTSSYTVYGIYADTLGEIDNENQGNYFIAATTSTNEMQYLKFNPSTLEVEELGVKATGVWVQTPRFIEANSQLYPIVGAYSSNRYDVHKLKADYQTGDLLIANNGNWKTSSELTTAISLPVGNTIERPYTAESGSLRFNSETNDLEYKDNSSWQPAATKNYVDNLLTSTITAAVWDPTNTAQTVPNASKVTFNYNSSRQTTTNDASQASWSTTNNEFALSEGTWHIMFDFRKDTQTSTAIRFWQILYKTTAGTGTSGTIIDASPTINNQTTNGDEKIHMEAFLTVPASTTYYVFALLDNGGNVTGRFSKMLCKRIA